MDKEDIQLILLALSTVGTFAIVYFNLPNQAILLPSIPPLAQQIGGGIIVSLIAALLLKGGFIIYDRTTNSSNDSELTENRDLVSDIPLAKSFLFLSHEHPRIVIEYLNKVHQEAVNQAVNCEELIELVAKGSSSKSPELTYELRKTLYVGLCQSYLPRMEEFNLIKYDQSRRVVVPNKKVRHVFRHLEVFRDSFADRLDATSNKDISMVFAALRNPKRRYVLHYFRIMKCKEMGLDNLSSQIAAWENDCSTDSLTPSQRRRIYTALSEHQLDELDHIGFVDFKKESKLVEITYRGEVASEYIRLFEGEKHFPLED